MPATSHAAVLGQVRRLAAAQGAEGRSDGELLQAFAERRDEAVFGVLVRRHGPLVLNVCRRVLRHEQDAEDAFQATFLALARHAAALRNRQALAAWLHRAAYRTALAARRAAVRRRHHEGKATAMTTRGPSADAAWREMQALLEDEVQRLPETYRVPFVLCCLEGASRADAARQLAVKEGTLSSRIDQARKRLRSRLARRGITLAAVLAATAVARPAKALGPRLCAVTARAAALLTSDPAAAARMVGPHVCALAAQGARALLPGRSRLVALLLGVWLAVAGVGLVEGQRRADPGLPAQPAAQTGDGGGPRRADVHGDPLPEGALARLGTLRFRPGGFLASLVVAPDGKTLVGLDTLGNVSVLDAADGRTLRRFATGAARQRPALSADGRWAVVLAGKGALPIDPEVSLELWDCARGTRTRAFGKAPYATACFSADGTVLAGLRYDGVVELWGPHAGRLVRSWKAGDGDGYDLFFTGRFTADGKRLVTSHKKQTVRCWDVATGARLREVSGLPPSDLFAVSPQSVLAVDGRGAAAPPGPGSDKPGEVRLRLIDLKTGKDLLRAAAPPETVPKGRPTWFVRGEFSPDGKQLVTAGFDNRVRLWDVATGKHVRSWEFIANVPGALGFFADGRRLALADGGTVVRLLDLAGGEAPLPPGNRTGFFEPRFTADGATVLTLCDNDQALHAWDAATGRLRRRLHWQAEQVALSALGHDGRTIFSWGLDRNLRRWDAATGEEVRRWEDGYGVPYIQKIVPSPDGKTLALVFQKPSIVLVDAGSGKEMRRLEAHSPWPFGASFSADGRSLVTWGGDGLARAWDLTTGKELRRIAYAEGPGAARGPAAPGGGGLVIFSAAVSRDARWLAFGGNGLIAIHDVASGDEVRRVEGLPANVSVKAFSPDGRTLAWAGPGDTAVRLLEVASGRERHRLAGHLGPVTSVAFSADGRKAVSGSEDTTALVWGLGPAAEPGPAGRDAAWDNLAHADAARAYRAVRRVAASPDVVHDRLRPVPPADAGRVARLIGELDSEEFSARAKAAAELERIGDVAGPACRKALQKAASAEGRRRLRTILDRYARAAREITPERLRSTRGLEALELSATPEARQALQKLAGGAEGAWLTEEAKASLRRLGGRAGGR
jgi:RNA polymerase sigma factor (sigma-70 family)